MHTEKNQPESALKQTKTDRVRRSYSEWEALVSEWERSNQSQKAFCESKNLCYRNFNQWKSRIKKAESGESSSATPQSPLFTPVNIANSTTRSHVEVKDSVVSIELPGQVMLRLNADAATVITLIKGLSAFTTC